MGKVISIYQTQDVIALPDPVLILAQSSPIKDFKCDLYINGDRFDPELAPFLLGHPAKRIWIECQEKPQHWINQLLEVRDVKVFVSSSLVKMWTGQRDGVLMGA